MKVLSIVSVLLLSLVLGRSGSFAQGEYPPPTDENKDQKMKTETWGEPVLERSVEGTRIQVWIMKSSDKPLGLNQTAPEGGTNKTHRVRVEVTDEAEKNLSQAKVGLKIMSPSGKASTEMLNATGEVHEGSLSLEESGTYKFTVTVTTSDGKTRNADFNYKV